jgi:glycosyltransferase involved in cell wall biosynthesis
MKKRPDSAITTIGQGLPAWIRTAVRVPFLFLMAWENARTWLSPRKTIQTALCRTVSVVIPTRNEEHHIVRCIRSFAGNSHVCEVIVVDAASGDQTQSLARLAGARVLIHDRSIENGGGRGGQIKEGIDEASGDVVAVVHADSILPENEIDRMIAVLNRCPDIVGGAIGCRFDSSRRRYRFIELANDFRASFLKISFGDQVQFFRRSPVVFHNLFPDMPIMEDVEFSIRLHRLGRRTYLFGNALASTRRWEQAGYQNAGWVVKNVAIYLVHRLRQRPDTSRIYRRYYNLSSKTNTTIK